MIKMISAFTEKIDDTEGAVSEILNKLDLANNILMQNSVGILHCYYEYIYNGVVKSLSEKLPFIIAGTSMNCVCVGENISEKGLILNVLTSDDVNFTVGISEPVGDNMPLAMKNLADGINSRLKENEKPPSMLITFVPLMLNISGDNFVEQINKLFDDVPAFGALPVSAETNFEKCYMIYNGEYFTDVVIIIALTGNVKPQFLTAAFPEKYMLRQKGLVTKSEDNLLLGVNGLSFEEYAQSARLIDDKKEDMAKQLLSTPFIADLDDGLRIVRVCFAVNDKGGAVMGGNIPEGAQLRFAFMDAEDIVYTTGKKIEEAVEIADGRNLLIYSCSARFWVLGVNNAVENNKIKEIIGDSIPFFSTYSGGEIFPQWLPNGKVVNHLQNYSLVMCMI